MAQRAVEAVLAEARAEIAAGRFPDVIALRAQLGGDADALARLDGVLAVHRARARMAQKVSDTSKVSDTLRTRPAINADMDVRRVSEFVLEWDAPAAVTRWEIKLSERADARSDYRVVRELETADPRLELPLGDVLLRVNIVGRSRTGKVVRRAIISGLTRETWQARWQKR